MVHVVSPPKTKSCHTLMVKLKSRGRVLSTTESCDSVVTGQNGFTCTTKDGERMFQGKVKLFPENSDNLKAEIDTGVLECERMSITKDVAKCRVSETVYQWEKFDTDRLVDITE